jgi:hypothetical protein
VALRLEAYPWATAGRLLALIALLLVILVALVPGVPEWTLALAVGLLALAVLLG